MLREAAVHPAGPHSAHTARSTATTRKGALHQQCRRLPDNREDPWGPHRNTRPTARDSAMRPD